jgi:flagellin
MTRINTNVSSLVAQNTLARSHDALNQALTRLSTGLRINSGQDDPAGLIASENLRSDITSIQGAISNTNQANEVIGTADSALGQVSSLLNDIRGLVTQSANTGALSTDQIAANQLQVDSSLKALNTIAQTTTFQGRRLLDGSLDFLTTAGTGFNTVSDLKINSANLGSTGSVSVAVKVAAAATQAQVTDTAIPAAVTPAQASGAVVLSHNIAQATGTLTTDSTNNAAFTITAKAGGAADGAAGNSTVNLVIVDGASEGASYNAGTNTLTATIDITGGNDTVTHLASVIGAGADFATSGVTNGSDTVAVTNTGAGTLTGGRDAGAGTITVTSDTTGANTHTVTLTEDNTITNNTAVAAIDGSGNIGVKVHGTVTYAAIKTAIDGLAGYTATLGTNSGDQNYVQSLDTPPSATTLAGGVSASGGLDSDIVVELSGATGADVLSFGAGTDIDTIVSAINNGSDSTGVSAANNGGTLTLTSTAYGSSAFVGVKVLSGDDSGTFAGGLSTPRATGTDIDASVNGIQASGNGNTLSINTATLDLSLNVNPGSSTDVNFTINGGGALFQLGPEVVSNQQSRIGITSVNTAKLGGTDGKLFQLGSGGTASLSADPTKAASIVDEAINQITSLRGRLGAFQRTSLDTNKNALNDTLVNLTDAQSQITDADFASETANLTRAQILVQSGTTVLQIANQNPQNVLALLKGA